MCPPRLFDTLPAMMLTFSSRASGEKRARTAFASSSLAAARSPAGMKPVFHVSGRRITSGAVSRAARRMSASARSKFSFPASERIFIWTTLTFMADPPEGIFSIIRKSRKQCNKLQTRGRLTPPSRLQKRRRLCHPQAANKFQSFFAAACTWRKTLCTERVCAPTARALSAVNLCSNN